MKLLKNGVSFLFVLLMVSLAIGTANAFTNVMVEPARVEVMVAPGHATNGSIHIVNSGTETVRMGAEVRDWEMTPKGEPVFTKPKERVHSSADWIRFNPRVFLLAPGKSQIVRYAINTPKGVKPGEYRAAVVFALEPADPVKKSFGFAGNVVTTIYANVAPVARRGSIISSVAAYRSSVMTVRTSVQSTGNAHLRLVGTFQIINTNGKTLGEGIYGGQAIFPEHQRDLAGEWRGSLPKGKYRIKSSFRFIPSLYAENMGEYANDLGLQTSAELIVE